MAVAQPPSSDDGTGADVDSEGADPWGFDDEEAAVETWASLIADQAVDLTLFIAFASLALVSFFRKSVGLKYLTLVAAVVYLGLSKSQLISVVNIYGVLTGNLPVLRYNLAWYLFAGFTVVSTVLWGRFYCGRICAFGALTQLMDRVVPGAHAGERAHLARAEGSDREVRPARRHAPVLSGDSLDLRLSVCRAVLDVHRPGQPRSVDRSGHTPRCDRLRQKPLLPVSCARSGRHSGCCRTSPSFASSGGRSAARARSVRRRASGAQSMDRLSQ